MKCCFIAFCLGSIFLTAVRVTAYETQTKQVSYVRGLGEEQNYPDTTFTVLNLKSLDHEDREKVGLSKGILSINADLVCIHNIDAVYANGLYEALIDKYAYFLYFDAETGGKNIIEERGSESTFIASKFYLEPSAFQRLEKNSSLLDEGLFGFVVGKGHAEASGTKDSEGNSKGEISVSTSTETENGTFSTEVKGGVGTDKDGNTTGEIKGTISWDW